MIQSFQIWSNSVWPRLVSNDSLNNYSGLTEVELKSKIYAIDDRNFCFKAVMLLGTYEMVGTLRILVGSLFCLKLFII